MSILSRSIPTQDIILTSILKEDNKYIQTYLEGNSLILSSKPSSGSISNVRLYINTGKFYEYGIETIHIKGMKNIDFLSIYMEEINGIRLINDPSNSIVTINDVERITGEVTLENTIIHPYYETYLNLSSNYQWYGLLKNQEGLFKGCKSIHGNKNSGILLHTSDIARTVYGLKQGFNKHQLWEEIYKNLDLKQVPFCLVDPGSVTVVHIDMNMYDLSLSNIWQS